MRYEKRTKKNKLGRTTKIEIVDTNTGEVLQSWSIPAYNYQAGFRREEKVGEANRAADAELVKLSKEILTSDITGETYGSEEEKRAAENEVERREELEENVAKFEGRITESGRLREEIAENVSARKEGQLLTQIKNAILGSGGDQSQIEAFTPQIQEQSARSLQDLIAGSKAQTQQQLAQFIPQEISAEYNQDALSDAMSKFLMDESTQRAQIQASLDSQPEWWETMLGQGGSAAGQAAGTALVTQGIPYLASLVSDRRMKENISQVGKLDNGLPVYVFNYKGDRTPQIGVMAQDVEKVNEDAVIEVDGVKMVNYKKAVQ